MAKFLLQFRDGLFLPANLAEEDKATRLFKQHQLINGDLKGEAGDPRSHRQLAAYCVGCQMVADNAPEDQLFTKEMVDYHVRVALRHLDTDKMTVIGKKIVINVKSISYGSMTQPQANAFFTEAYGLIAKYLGISKEELMQELRSRGQRP